MKKTPLIAVVDSGIGGLGLLGQCHKNLGYDFFYIMDNKFCPYGQKSVDVICERVLRICLYAQNVIRADCIVLACNTATSVAIDIVRKNITIPVVGMEPPIKLAISSGEKNIIVMSTPITNNYNKLLMGYRTQNIQFVSCPDLAQKIERNFFCLDELGGEIENLFSAQQKEQCSAVVLGCSHFQFVKNQIERVFDKDITFYCSEPGVQKRIEHILCSDNQNMGYGKISIAQTSFDPYLLEIAKSIILS